MSVIRRLANVIKYFPILISQSVTLIVCALQPYIYIHFIYSLIDIWEKKAVKVINIDGNTSLLVSPLLKYA